jgi:diguanylate cyclase (GGDEF)-like protein
MVQSTHTDVFSVVDSKNRRLLVIAWLFVAIVAFVLGFNFYSISMVSAGRAYVGGEGMWSKAQRDMIYSLALYVRSRDSDYYQTYRKALAVTQGDRQARIELEKKDPDLQLAYTGFLQGRNHPEDIDGMIRLFRDFRHVAEIDQAIDIWTRADVYIEQVVRIAEEIQTEVKTGTLDDAASARYLQQLHGINEHLMPLEDDFSHTLGLAAHKMQAILLFVMFAVVSALVTGAYLFSRRLVRQNDSVHKALREAGMQFRGLLQAAPLSIVINGLNDDMVLYANEHALRQFKVSTSVIGRLRVSSFYINSDDRQALIAALREDGSVREWEVRLQDSTGAQFWTLISSQIISYNGQDCILSALSNIDARKRSHEEMRHRAFHDELTGLPNRAMFMDWTRKRIAEADPNREVFAILFIDLDRFKLINDDLGHEMGDRLLQQVALRLKANVNQEDIVSRLGGDEFVVLMEVRDNLETVRQAAEKIVQAMAPTFVIDDIAVGISTSIGISCFPLDGVDLKTLLKNADVAMYQAKDEGRSNAQFYSDVSQQRLFDDRYNRAS